MRAQPGAARLPREPCGRRALDRRREISLVGPRVVALVRRVDHERLKREPAIVALIQLAPGIADLVLVARPRAGGGDARVGGRMPLGLAPGLPLVAPVLLPVAVGVTAAEGEAATQLLAAVRAGDVEAAEPAGVVAELPDTLRRIGIRARRGAHPTVKADRKVVRDDVRSEERSCRERV